MANIAPMTLQQLEEAIHVLYENSTDYPTSGDDDWNVRLALINAWINRWENVDGTLWHELWGVDTSRSVSYPTVDYLLPTDFKFPGGFIRLIKPDGSFMQLKILPPEKAQLMDASEWYAIITGRPGAYSLTINGLTDTTWNGATIRVPYYKLATKLATSSNVTECPDPYYIVHGVVADLHSMNRYTDGYDLRLEQAETRLGQMQARNEMVPPFMDNTIDDVAYELGGGGFGY
jgi:hypothetical protein